MSVIIYSERMSTIFSESATNAGLDVNVFNTMRDFSNMLKVSHKHIIINCDTATAVNDLRKIFTQLNGLLSTGMVETIQFAISKEYSDIIKTFEAHEKTEILLIEEKVTQEIINEMLVVKFKSSEYYGNNKAKRAPLVGASPEVTKREGLNDFVSFVLNNTANIQSKSDLIVMTNNQKREKTTKMQELDKKTPTDIEGNIHEIMDNRKKIVSAVYDLSTANNAMSAIPALIDQDVSSLKDNISITSKSINQTIRLRDVENDEQLIREKLDIVRKEVSTVDKLFSTTRNSLGDIKNYLLELPVPPKEELLELIDNSEGFVDKETATTLVEMSIALTRKKSEVFKHYKEAVESMAEDLNKMHSGFRKVTHGYESVIADSFSLIDKLKTTANISITSDNAVGSNLAVMFGTAQSGTTNYAVCTAYSMSEEKEVCIIDMKTNNPQLHYYTRGVELEELFSKDLSQVATEIEAHMKNNKFLAITNKKIKMLETVYGQSKVLDFVKDLISLMATKDISVIVVTNPIDCRYKTEIENMSIITYIVTDTNIGKTEQLNNVIRLSLMNKNTKVRFLVVTKNNIITPTAFLTKAGIPTNRFVIKSVPDLPIDAHKIQNSIYSQSNPWRY